MRHYSKLIKFGIAAFALLAVVTGVPGFPQSQPPKPPDPQTNKQTPAPTNALRVLTRLVQVSVIAEDGNGKPVVGLTQNDFTVTEGGQPQKINYFTEQSNENLTLTASQTPPAPNTFSNRYEQKANAPTSATVILLDTRNTRAMDMAFARKQVDTFLNDLQPQDRVALYVLGSKLRILHDFTQDAASIRRALGTDPNVDDFRIGASEPGAADTGDANMDAAVSAANGRAAEFYMNNRVEQTALAIKTIADHLKGLPGRKNLVWVSAAFPIDILTAQGPTPQAPERTGSGGGSGGVPGPITGVTSYTDQIEDATRSLNSANVAVYPVDARGLIGNPNTASQPGPRGRGAARPNNASPFPPRQNFDTMNTFAERTGGKAFYNTNDIHGAVRKALDDSKVTYVLGYYPTNTNWDGKFREIKVRTDKSGVHLHYRLGYFALPDSTMTDEEKARLMTDAEWSPLEATDLALEVQANPIIATGGRELQVQVRIASNQLHFEQIDTHWKDSLDLVWVEAGPGGRPIGKITKTVGLDVPADSYDLLVTKGISFTETIKVSADAIEVRLVTRDNGSGAIGSVIIPVSRLFAKPAGTSTAPKN
jgi:VWFA-related protein